LRSNRYMPKHDEQGHGRLREGFLRNRSDSAGEPRADFWRQGLLDYLELDVDASVMWKSIGPSPLYIESRVVWANSDGTTTPDSAFQGVGPDSGEVTDIAIDPSGTADMTLYIATNDGGIWKTSDGGSTWVPTMDSMPSLSIGAVAVDAANPQIVYAGTGNPFDGGVVFTKGVGIFRSTDGGRSWGIVDGGILDTIFAGTLINRIVVPAPGILLVATNNGLFRSADGGQNFGKNAPLFNDRDPVLEGFITCLVAEVRDPANTLYAGVYGSGVYKSTDGGATFPPGGNLFLNFGAPPQPFGNLEIAQSEKSPERLLVSVQYSPRGQNPVYRGLFETTNGGTNWRLLSWVDAAADDGFGQTDYDLTLAIDPQNDQLVYAGFQELWRSTDGGVGFGSPACTWAKLHWDHHALALSPPSHRAGSPTRVYVGTDGGIAKSTDGGTTWTSINGAIASNLLLGIGIGRGAGNVYTYGGCQDTGTSAHRTSDAGTTVWHLGIDGDGYVVAVDPADPKTFYGFDNNMLIKSTDEGKTFRTSSGAQVGVTPIGNGLPDFGGDTPMRSIALEQNGTDAAARVVYVGLNQQLCKSSNAGEDFIAIYQAGQNIMTLATTTANFNHVWVGSMDGSVHCSTDGGATWDQTPNFKTTPGPGFAATAIAVDPAKASRVTVTYAGQPGIDATYRTQHAYLTTDGGVTWNDISGTDGAGPAGNLPDLPLHSVVFDASVNPSAIIVAGDAGVMRCSNASGTGANVKATWKIYGAGLPNVSCMSLAIDNSVKPPVIRVGTYGRGCFEVTRPHGPAMSVESSLGFGFTRQGASSRQPLYIYNSGDAPLAISAITRTTGAADFAIGAVTLPATVAPGGTLTVPVVFTPLSAGNVEAVFQITSNDAHSPYALAVSGTGLAAGPPRLATNPSRVTGFGVAPLGTRRTILLQMLNTGMSDLHVASVQVAGSPDFSVRPITALPATIVPGGEADVTLTYQPSAAAPAQATVQIVSDDPRGMLGVQVNGWGI
jgi:photosystem II stability/assembly factor-like uncharacterized protein